MKKAPIKPIYQKVNSKAKQYDLLQTSEMTQEELDILKDKVREMYRRSCLTDFTRTRDFMYFTNANTDYGLDYDIVVDTLFFNSRGYKAYENLASRMYTTDNLVITMSIDYSGYNYWNKLQEESNYLILTIRYQPNHSTVTDRDLEGLDGILWELKNALDNYHNNNTYALKNSPY